jgi:hypothetical protein
MMGRGSDLSARFDQGTVMGVQRLHHNRNQQGEVACHAATASLAMQQLDQDR